MNDYNELVDKAVKGDKGALEQVVEEIKDFVYNLSLRMLLFPEDAQDATQEILIRVITHLSIFKRESKFETWVYRIASNYLITEGMRKKRKAESVAFEEYAEQIDTGQSDKVLTARNEGELKLLEEEVKVSCTHGLLFCLSPVSRLVYILGDVLDFNSKEAAIILDVTPENFRKHLSRSRVKIRSFLQAKCGIVNPANPCRCKRKIDFLVEGELIDQNQLRFAHHTNRSIDLVHKIDSLGKTLDVFRSVPVIEAPTDMINKVRKTINSINF